MRLRNCIPSVPADLIDCLEKCGIRTDADLLFSSSVFDIFCRLPSGTISLNELTKYTEIVAELSSAPGISGIDLLRKEQQLQDASPDILSGIPQLDVITGGFSGRQIFEISGDKQSGKSALVLHIALRHLVLYPQSSVLWMDTTGDFSAERAFELLSHYDSEAASTALDRLRVSLVFDIETAYNLLEEFDLSVSTPSENQLQCIVIDSISPLLGPLLSAVSSQGHATMVGFMHHLRQFSQSHSLSVFVINNSTSSHPNNLRSTFNSTGRKPALGPSFTFLTSATLWLSKYENQDESKRGCTTHTVEIIRSKTMARPNY